MEWNVSDYDSMIRIPHSYFFSQGSTFRCVSGAIVKRKVFFMQNIGGLGISKP